MSNTRVQIEITLGALFVVLSAGLLLWLGFQEPVQLVSQADIQRAEAIEVGATLFETNCSRCHGDQGQGLIGPPLNDPHFFSGRLDEVGWGGTLGDYIVSTVSVGRLTSTRPEQWPGEGRPAMPTWSQDYGGPLRPDQIRDIAEFILNWKTVALDGVAVTVDKPPAPMSADPVARGRAVFKSAGCVACHTLPDAGSVGVVGPELTHIANHAATRIDCYSAQDYIHESILTPNAYVVEGFQENLMPQTFGDTLSEGELNDLITYLLAQE